MTLDQVLSDFKAGKRIYRMKRPDQGFHFDGNNIYEASYLTVYDLVADDWMIAGGMPMPMPPQIHDKYKVKEVS